MERKVPAHVNGQNQGSEALNVLLHGAFTFVPHHERIVVLIPNLPHHVYRAGSWLGETQLRAGRYGLDGVEGQKPNDQNKFNPCKNLLVKFNGQLPEKPLPYATLELPLPKKITTLCTVEVDTKYFSHPELLAVDGPKQHLSTLQVFTYGISNENRLQLRAERGDGHYWEPAFVKDHINLHIFASEDYYHRPSNAEEDINECIALLGADMKLRLSHVPERDSLNPGDLPKGVEPQETESLSVRTLRMARLGRLVVQEDGDANLAWYGNDALDGGQPGCDDCVGVYEDY
jgi:hypothetical protein